MFNKDTFNEPNNEEVVITPDSEVFVSYKGDPLFILILSQFARLKNEIGNNDYFLVFDISANNMKKAEIGGYIHEDFLEFLKTRCGSIPDLVSEQLQEAHE